MIVEAPRLNANEDQMQVIEVLVADGQRVQEGDLLFILETTKAANDVLAPATGVVEGVRLKAGDFIEVGATLCELSAGGDLMAASGASGDTATTASEEVQITAKARKVASDLGVALATVKPVGNRIGEAEVRAAAARPPAPAPARMFLTNSRRAVIIGGGGHAACLIDALDGAGYTIIGCVDERLEAGHPVCAGVSVIGRKAELASLLKDGVRYAFIGVGGAQSNLPRRRLFEEVIGLGFVVPAVIHPSATVSKDVRLADGCQVLSGVTIGPRCMLGANVVVNQGSILCHDSIVHDHAHLTPGSIVAGGVTIGAETTLGMGATVLFGLKVGARCLVHNGAAIATDVADDTVVDGQGRRLKADAAG